jgi:hypothetical protein
MLSREQVEQPSPAPSACVASPGGRDGPIFASCSMLLQNLVLARGAKRSRVNNEKGGAWN